MNALQEDIPQNVLTALLGDVHTAHLPAKAYLEVLP